MQGADPKSRNRSTEKGNHVDHQAKKVQKNNMEQEQKAREKSMYQTKTFKRAWNIKIKRREQGKKLKRSRGQK